jgi:hypothetical protein
MTAAQYRSASSAGGPAACNLNHDLLIIGLSHDTEEWSCPNLDETQASGVSVLPRCQWPAGGPPRAGPGFYDSSIVAASETGIMIGLIPGPIDSVMGRKL